MMRNGVFMTYPAGIALALTLAACAGGGTPAITAATSVDPAHGKEVFLSTCMACHGPDGAGLPNLGNNLIVSEFVSTRTDAELVTYLKVGRTGADPLNTTGLAMPPKGGNPALTDKELADVVVYLRILQARG
jgi:disulfide bond formation protein DsbB